MPYRIEVQTDPTQPVPEYMLSRQRLCRAAKDAGARHEAHSPSAASPERTRFCRPGAGVADRLQHPGDRRSGRRKSRTFPPSRSQDRSPRTEAQACLSSSMQRAVGPLWTRPTFLQVTSVAGGRSLVVRSQARLAVFIPLSLESQARRSITLRFDRQVRGWSHGVDSQGRSCPKASVVLAIVRLTNLLIT
jgi:hypothetical protein